MTNTKNVDFRHWKNFYLLFYLLDDMNGVYGGRTDLCNVYVNLSNLKKSDINMIGLLVLLLLFFSCFHMPTEVLPPSALPIHVIHFSSIVSLQI